MSLNPESNLDTTRPDNWREVTEQPVDTGIDPRWDKDHQYSGLTYAEWMSGKEFPKDEGMSTLPENFVEVEEVKEIANAALNMTVDFPHKEDEASQFASPSFEESISSLEVISEKPILSLTIDGKKTNFTELIHYNPKVESTVDVYPIPEHISDFLKDDKYAIQTYEKNAQDSRWKEKLFDFTKDFLTNDPRGNVVLEGLEVQSLGQLTPEQATKLSLCVVEILSRYSEDADTGGKAADEKTTLQILYEGKMRKGQPGWEGNGICRNIASNVKAVFEALKDGQDEQNMLGNTYVTVVGASRGRTYGQRERDNPNGVEKDEKFKDFGHAWNTFVTVGGDGETVITTVDATFALNDSKPDYTVERTYEDIQKLYEHADDKFNASSQMIAYLDKYVNKARAEKAGYLGQRLDFAFTEYLKYADVMLKSDKGMVRTPRFDLFNKAYKLRDDLSLREIETLYGVGKTNESLELYKPNINSIVDAYIARMGQDTSKLIVKDDDLQRLIFERMGDEQKAYLTRDKFRLGGDLNRRFNQLTNKE